MANENNVMPTFEVLTSESEQIQVLEENSTRVTNVCNLFLDKNLKHSSEMDQMDQALSATELERDNLKKLPAKHSRQNKKLAGANEQYDKLNNNKRTRFSDAKFTRNMQEDVDRIWSIEHNYAKKTIQSDIDEEMKSRTEYLNTLHAVYIQDEELPLDEMIEIFEYMDEHEELEKAIKDSDDMEGEI